MSYHLMYYLEVKPGHSEEFELAWRDFSTELQGRYPSCGSAIFKTDQTNYLIIALWPSKEVWQTFWVTKEIALESLTRVKSCLASPSQPVSLDPIHSDWHLIA